MAESIDDKLYMSFIELVIAPPAPIFEELKVKYKLPGDVPAARWTAAENPAEFESDYTTLRQLTSLAGQLIRQLDETGSQ